jgi:competence protein ComK
MENYIIDEENLAIIGEKDKSIVYSGEEKYVVNMLSTDIIKNSCIYYGSSLKGRIDGTKEMLGITYKAPIIISEGKRIVMFPTNSYKVENCTWINLKNIDNYYTDEEKNTIIIFKNGVKIKLNLSVGIFDKQMLRTMRLISVLNKRINDKNTFK